MTLSVLSIMAALGWMWQLHELPTVDLTRIPASQTSRLHGKSLRTRAWLLGIDNDLHMGRGDGRLTHGEFLLARDLRRFRVLRRWDSFTDFRRFLERSQRVGRCRQQTGKRCPTWPALPPVPTVMKGQTREKRKRIRYRDSRYHRLCREMASTRNRTVGTTQVDKAALSRLKARRKRLKALMDFVQSLPKYKTNRQWVVYLRKQWKRPAFRRKLHSVIGFAPTKRQFLTVIRLIKRGKRPDAQTIMTLSWTLMRSPLVKEFGPNMLAGWLVWGGDQRSFTKRWADWKAFLRQAPLSCRSPRRKMLSRAFLCGTTLQGAMILLSKSTLLNHFARNLLAPFRATTFDESMRRCLLGRLGAWMTHGYGQRCLSKPQQNKLFTLLARGTMHRYEPYAPARLRALNSLYTWKPTKSLPCLISALHPRKEPKSYVRQHAMKLLVRLARNQPRKTRVIRKYLRRTVLTSFDTRSRFRATHALSQLHDPAVIASFLKRLHIRPHACRLGFQYRKRGKTLRRFTNTPIPPGFWSVLSEDFWLGQRPPAARKVLYRLVQCQDAPFSYVFRVMRFLQPNAEPLPELRKTLWNALLHRFLFYHRVKPFYRHPRNRWFRRYEQAWAKRNAGKSTRALLLKHLHVYLRFVSLSPKVESNQSVRQTAAFVAASLHTSETIRLLQKSIQREPAIATTQVRRALSHQVVLWPYHQKRFVGPFVRRMGLRFYSLRKIHLRHMSPNARKTLQTLAKKLHKQHKEQALKRLLSLLDP